MPEDRPPVGKWIVRKTVRLTIGVLARTKDEAELVAQSHPDDQWLSHTSSPEAERKQN